MTELLRNTSDIGAAVESGYHLASSQRQQINGVPVVIAPENFKVHELPHLRETPRFINAKPSFTTIQSLIDYLNRFKTLDTVIFADPTTAKIHAIIDYHQNKQANNCLHKALFDLKKTPEASDWINNNRKEFIQDDFGTFIEDHICDIMTPSGAELLEIALNLKAQKNIRIDSAKRLSDGQTQFTYHEEIDGKSGITGQLKIPEEFSLGLQVFAGGDNYVINARFKYRVKSSGQLTMWYELIRPHKTIESCVNDSLELLKTALPDIPVYYSDL